MKTIILFFILMATLRGQYLTKEKILFFGSTILSSFLSGTTEGMQQREQHMPISPEEKLKLNKQWHITQTLERVSWVGTGVTIALDSKFNIWKMLSNLSVSGGIHWILYDIIENRWRDKPAFWVSDWQKEHNTSLTDKFATWQLKIVYLAVVIFINYLIN